MSTRSSLDTRRSRNMFTYCLLLVLLLLAVVDFSTSEESPPYLTSKSAGDPNLVGDVHRSKKFEIPSGDLDAQYNPAEACAPNSHLVQVAVQVWDYEEDARVYVSEDLQSLVVTRTPPALGRAVLQLDVACSY